MIPDDQLPDRPGVYIVHFERPIGHAKNYLGSGKSIRTRIARHRAGNGAKLIAEANRLGIGWQVSRYWLASTGNERVRLEVGLKNRRDTPKICPACTPGTTRASNPKPATRRTARNHPPIRKETRS